MARTKKWQRKKRKADEIDPPTTAEGNDEEHEVEQQGPYSGEAEGSHRPAQQQEPPDNPQEETVQDRLERAFSMLLQIVPGLHRDRKVYSDLY